MIIDVNGYVGVWPHWPTIHTTVEAMLAKMDRYGIGRVYIASLKAAFSDTEAGNDEMQAVCRAHPERFAPAFSYSPYAAGFARYREELLSVPKRMVKLFPLSQGYEPLEEPAMAELLEFCGEHAIPVIVPHRLLMSWRLPRYPIQSIGQMAARHPQTRFLIASVNYTLELQTALDVLRRHPNTFIETSAMMALREIDYVAARIGVERMLHGSAIPLQNPAIGPLKIQTSALSDSDRARLFWRNAEETLGL